MPGAVAGSSNTTRPGVPARCKSNAHFICAGLDIDIHDFAVGYLAGVRSLSDAQLAKYLIECEGIFNPEFLKFFRQRTREIEVSRQP